MEKQKRQSKPRVDLTGKMFGRLKGLYSSLRETTNEKF